MKLTLALIALLFSTLLATGCGSTRRTPVEGYTDAMLNGRRLFLLVPEGDDISLVDAETFASRRGAVAASATEIAGQEINFIFTSRLQQLLDSNTVLSYREEPVGGVVPLDATRDFDGGQPRSWEAINRARAEADFDFLLVVSSVAVSSSGDRERVEATYGLFDVANGRVMRSGPVTASAPAGQGGFVVALADELAARLPFWVGE